MPVVIRRDRILALNQDTAWISAQGVDAGDKLWNLPTTMTAPPIVCYCETPAAPGEMFRCAIAATAPSGPTWTAQIAIQARSAAGDIGTEYSSQIPLTTTSQTLQATAVLPAGTTTVRVNIYARSADAAARKLLLGNVDIGRIAAADELLTARLSRPLNRTAIDTPAGPLFTTSTPGNPTGTLQFIHPTQASVTALDLCCQDGAIILESGCGDLTGQRFMPIDRFQVASDRPVPGKPVRWITSIDVKGVN